MCKSNQFNGAEFVLNRSVWVAVTGCARMWLSALLYRNGAEQTFASALFRYKVYAPPERLGKHSWVLLSLHLIWFNAPPLWVDILSIVNISVYYYKVKLHSSAVFRLRVGVWCSSCPVHPAVSLPSHSAGAGVPRRGSVSSHTQDSSCSAPPRSLPRPSTRLARTVSPHHRQLELPLLHLRLYVSVHSAAALLYSETGPKKFLF